MNEQRARFVLPFAMLMAILAVSTASIFIRFAQREETPSIVIAAWRLTLASLILAPLALTRYRRELSRLTRAESLPALLAGLFLALHFAAWITSLEYTSVASSVVLVTTTPLWVAMLSPIVLRERIGPAAVIGMLLAILGGSLIALSDTCRWNNGLVCPPASEFLRGQSMLGNLLALLGAWMASGYILVGRKLRAKMALVPYIFTVYSVAAVVLIAIMLGMGQRPFGYTPSVYGWFFLLAFIPQLFGHTTFNWALRYLPASLVSVALLGEPVGSTILAIFLLREIPSIPEIIGGIIILAGIYLASLKTGGDKG